MTDEQQTDEPAAADPVIAAELLELLACPACDDRPPVTLSQEGAHLQCTNCRRRYPIVDGIPVMLVDEAETCT